MGGATIIPRSPKTTRNEKIFQDRPKIFLFFKSYVTLKYLLIIDFPKFDPLTAAEMAFCVNLGPKCQNLFPHWLIGVPLEYDDGCNDDRNTNLSL
jgi:hypothetical protein